jgi:hypothetical protein
MGRFRDDGDITAHGPVVAATQTIASATTPTDG